MYTIVMGNQTIKRYKLQWKAYNGKRYYIRKTAILHGISLQNIKDKALSLFGIMPDNIIRV